MNLVDVGNVEVCIDYCHNAAGMRAVGEFVERYAEQNEGRSDLKMSRIGLIGAAGDRRDEDMRELGAVAALHFDVLVVREDDRLRGRRAGETASLVADGVRQAMSEGARCRQVEVVLDEIEAVGHVMTRTNPGDLVMMCVDQHAQVLAELENRTNHAQAGSHASEIAGDPDLDPAELAVTAERRVRRPRRRPSARPRRPWQRTLSGSTSTTSRPCPSSRRAGGGGAGGGCVPRPPRRPPRQRLRSPTTSPCGCSERPIGSQRLKRARTSSA